MKMTHHLVPSKRTVRTQWALSARLLISMRSILLHQNASADVYVGEQ